MADVTPILINQLTSQTTLQDTDYFIVGGDDAKKITVAQMKEALGINSLNTKLSALIMIEQKSAKVSIEANGVSVSKIDIDISGYKAIAVSGFAPNVYGVIPELIEVFEENSRDVLSYRFRNINTSTANPTLWFRIMYLKE